ncbi:Predicted arabinose efflux permease, MFS family [Frankineae bacterium MT45]|nr:Predicted arabinose efflux permease, MFS family [Frankineae bacterium MT45]
MAAPPPGGLPPGNEPAGYGPAGTGPTGYGPTSNGPTSNGPAAKTSLPRSVAATSNRAARGLVRRVVEASKADGAHESGLTALIWNQVLSYGTDAMITVALAGTVFFGASSHAQRGNVLLYLLVTMAPFAVVAPVIGPALDRLQHGRRWAMAGTAIGRAVLAVMMAEHSDSLLVLYPCALGSLVLSKAYSVIRSSAAPRLVPPRMTLVEANARLSLFGLGAAIIGGAFVGAVIKLSGSYTAGLLVTAVAFGVCGYFAFKLPPQVDSAAPAPRHPEEPRRAPVEEPVPSWQRLMRWASRGMAPQVVTSLQGESALRFLSGLLTIYLAFYIESTSTGFDAVVALSGIAIGTGAGNFLGTGIGTRLKLKRPEIVITVGVLASAAVCVVVALFFSMWMAVAGMFVSSVANSLSKIALDAVIQRDVEEKFRSSAFGRSETFLQLAWVVGAAIGVVLPSKDGQVGFWVAGVTLAVVGVVVALRTRAVGRRRRRATEPDHAQPRPGNVSGGYPGQYPQESHYPQNPPYPQYPQ